MLNKPCREVKSGNVDITKWIDLTHELQRDLKTDYRHIYNYITQMGSSAKSLANLPHS
jgi:hypothetical protein